VLLLLVLFWFDCCFFELAALLLLLLLSDFLPPLLGGLDLPDADRARLATLLLKNPIISLSCSSFFIAKPSSPKYGLNSMSPPSFLNPLSSEPLLSSSSPMFGKNCVLYASLILPPSMSSISNDAEREALVFFIILSFVLAVGRHQQTLLYVLKTVVVPLSLET
jgi:hypothetical protein